MKAKTVGHTCRMSAAETMGPTTVHKAFLLMRSPYVHFEFENKMHVSP